MPAIGERICWRHGPPLPDGIPLVLPELLAQAERLAGPATVFVDHGTGWTWADLATASARLAARWARQVRPGERVALVAANGTAHLLAELAVWRLAGVVVPVFAGQGPERIAAAIVAARAVLVVADHPDHAPAGIPCCPTAAVLAAAVAPGPTVEPRPVGPDDPCLLLATSGSSGAPRAVLLSHRTVCTQQAAYALAWPEVGPGDRLAAYLPWHHSFGALAERLWALVRGATLTVVPGGGRDHPAFLATVAAVAPTVFVSVPRMHRVAIAGGVLTPRDLRFAFTAGAPLASAEESWYADHGVPLVEGWGLTETGPTATLTRRGAARIPGVVGEPAAGVSVGVRADGRLLVAGPGLMLGYEGDPAGTAASTGSDPVVGRWLDTGDQGRWTAHGLHLEGRADQAIKLPNGERVALAALAAALEAQPGVRAAHVCCRDGETVEAIIAGQGDTDVTTLAAALAAVNARERVPFRRIARGWRLTEDPACANGLLTPSLKVAGGAWLAAVTEGRATPLPRR